MKHYELFYLASAQVPENQLETIQDEISGWITKLGGSVTKRESWGRKKLAYPVNKEKFGFYLLNEFDLDSLKLAELQKDLRLHKLIMRYLLLDKKPMSAKELLMQENAKRRALTRSQGTDVRPGKRTEVPATSNEENTTASKKEAKISLDDLDKKLDELLDTEMIN
jgi:small subunit ribosomal protein S6